MTRRHIVVVPSWYSTGRGSGGGYFRDQALALQAAGHRVAILAPDIHTRRDLRAGRSGAAQVTVEQDGVPVYRRSRRVLVPRLPYRNAIAWSLCGLSLFREYVAANGLPDLIHAHSGLDAGVLARAIKARYRIPYVITEHSAGFAGSRLRLWQRDLFRRVFRHADARIAVSPRLAALLEAQFPLTAWTYLPNILGEVFLQPLDKAAVAQSGDGMFTFICAGRLSAEKNHAFLIDAFADAFAGDGLARLQLIGSGPTEAELRRRCAERGIGGQIEFCGALPSDLLRAAMLGADAFVLASDYETFGVAVIEALAVGLPVVSTASGGPDHLIDPRNGLLVPVGNRAALREALVEMRRRAGGYDRAAIRGAAISRFGPAAFARGFEEIVGNLPRRHAVAGRLVTAADREVA